MGLKQSIRRLLGKQRHGETKGGFLSTLQQFEDQAPVRLCLDVGANAGHFAREFRAAFPPATIHCFEPGEDAFQQLQTLAGQDSQVRAHRTALGNRSGSQTFFLNAKSVTHSLLPVAADATQWAPATHITPTGTAEVKVATCDEFCGAHSIDHVSLLKVDTQGYDLKVLEGARSLLETGKCDWIYVEMMFVPIYDGQCHFHEIYNHLIARGYSLFRFYGGVHSPTGKLKWTNGLFSRAGLV